MTMKNDAKLEEVFTFVSKFTWGLWWILAWALENLNNLPFNGLSLTKSYYVKNYIELKRYRGVMFDGT